MNFGDERLPKRFWDKVQPCPMSGCWLWVGADNGRGYGNFRPTNRTVYSHRLAYQAAFGDIPDGLQLDHLCRVRACCNPLHLEPVTNAENARRGDAGKARGAQLRAVTHCPKGHEYDGDNVVRGSKGERLCRECLRYKGRMRERAKAAQKRQAA